jgi:hypothetical protein
MNGRVRAAPSGPVRRCGKLDRLAPAQPWQPGNNAANADRCGRLAFDACPGFTGCCGSVSGDPAA